jgi:hypothetical protein
MLSDAGDFAEREIIELGAVATSQVVFWYPVKLTRSGNERRRTVVEFDAVKPFDGMLERVARAFEAYVALGHNRSLKALAELQGAEGTRSGLGQCNSRATERNEPGRTGSNGQECEWRKTRTASDYSVADRFGQDRLTKFESRWG